ncbi:MFS transporter [Limosilactobacillus reuteri]|uniref:MFS transporter n=1 Tax=Limosilactobacillus reuteri TaxID=1598 RepID=A0AAE5J633_LIMRT|nr:aldo/keto reductase [Limosilactobacillus reuteri]MCC4342309.1 aldo/keto reductase [Limosilactobacillus reuteri]MCC4370437.1 aldo/keto reductase [Limosilactobacillus reuteri]MCC4398367.1 aldo/keto reductase [Limosilactobacillus reuteri]MCC4409949.1 aldo/keto reductase [Limosilactobacillus reuteri]OTA42412.1 MFS transporter [Limosilactobacillus reuteri]
MNQNLQPKIKLNNGHLIPQLGLGVWKASLAETQQMVKEAVMNDYVLIDTAKQYGNEAAVGQGIQDGFKATGRERDSIFLTTKIFNGDQGDYDKLRQAVNEQLKKLQTNYVDLLLLHWPVNDKYNESWRALEDIYADGQAKSIGVCNFNVERMTDLLDHAKIKPAINQIEFNPLIHQPKIVKFCRENDIQLEAWSPLGNGRLLSNDVIKQIADEHQKSPAQVILRWEIQQDFVVLTKTTHPQRMQENAEIFDFTLSPDEMKQIDKLDQEKHSIWYDKFKWSGNPDGVDDYIGKPGAF